MTLKLVTLSKLINIRKSSKKKIVLSHGVFDVFHYGHKKHFESAKKFGDILVVSLTSDKFVNKGPGRPFFNQNIRSDLISALGIVDYVIINDSETPINLLKNLKPDYYVKGPDYSNLNDDITKNIYREKKAVEKSGGKLVFTEDQKFSSTKLINNYLNNNSISKIVKKKNLSIQELKMRSLNSIKNISDLKVAVIGEFIFDQYVYCNELDRPSKENISAVSLKNKNTFLGGSYAVARNLSNFVKKIDLFVSGNFNKDQINLISKDKKEFKNLKLKIFKNKYRVITKTRYINAANRKLFEIYNYSGDYYNANYLGLLRSLKKKLSNYDLVIVCDFGHQLFNKEIISEIISSSKFLSINAQTNAENRGFNLITKYKYADFICIDEPELRLALSDKNTQVKDLIRKLYKKIKVKKIIVTLGPNGIIVSELINGKVNYFSLPAFEKNPIDTIGAGDAVLAISSALLAKKSCIYSTATIANLFGALKTKIRGHADFIKKGQVLKSLDNLLNY